MMGRSRPGSACVDVRMQTCGPMPTSAPMVMPPAACRNAACPIHAPRPDHELVLVVALQDRVVPDIDILVERDVLRMEHERARLENDRLGTPFQLRAVDLTRAVRTRGHVPILDS